jgi:sulfatase-modifying factor enzyme 1
MAGNVWQWTEDCYDNSYAGIPADGRANEAPSSDPVAKDGQGNCLRVDRGSSWMFPAWLLRPATRERNPPDYRDAIMGFRVARTITQELKRGTLRREFPCHLHFAEQFTQQTGEAPLLETDFSSA